MNSLQNDDRTSSFGRRLLGMVGLGVGVVVLYFLTRPPEPAVDSRSVMDRPDIEPPSLTDSESTIRLPTMAVPASVEALEQETRRVAEFLLAEYPGLPAAMHVAAVMHAQMRETSEAQRLWQQCVQRAPDDPRYRVNLASVAMDQGDSQSAVATLQDLVQGGSESADVLLHYGMSLNNVGDSQQAEQVLSKAVKLFPDSGSHWSVLGQAQLKNGEFQLAADSLRRAVDLGVQLPDVFFQLSTAHSRLGHSEQADSYQRQFEELKASVPIDAQDRFRKLSTAEARNTAASILLEAATVHQAQGDLERAELYLLRLLSLDPANLLACRTLADLYQHQGALREEQTAREHLLLLEPFRFENLLTLAQVAAELKQFDRAESYLKQAVAQQPTSAAPYAALAEFYLQIDQPQQARWYAEETVRRAPSADGYQFLAKTCRLLGDQEGEQQALQAAKMKND